LLLGIHLRWLLLYHLLLLIELLYMKRFLSELLLLKKLAAFEAPDL
jgi:hypothetical protein